MARIQNGILDSYSGKVGTVVGSNWRKIKYLRALPKKVKRVATAKQLEQRAKFTLAIKFLKGIKNIVNIGFQDKKRTNTTGFNLALSSLIQKGISGKFPTYQIEYKDLLISDGSGKELIDVKVDALQKNKIKVNWQFDLGSFFGAEEDQIIVLFYNKNKNQFFGSDNAKRKDKVAELTVPANYSQDSIIGWVFSVSKKGFETSKSQFLGESKLG